MLDYLFIFFWCCSILCHDFTGISGSYILLLMGVYSVVISAITEKEYVVIAVVGIGVIVGLLSFSRVLKWLFTKFKSQMLAVLTGIMLGSINKIWPWKQTITTYIDRHGEEKPLLESIFYRVLIMGFTAFVGCAIGSSRLWADTTFRTVGNSKEIMNQIEVYREHFLVFKGTCHGCCK